MPHPEECYQTIHHRRTNCYRQIQVWSILPFYFYSIRQIHSAPLQNEYAQQQQQDIYSYSIHKSYLFLSKTVYSSENLVHHFKSQFPATYRHYKFTRLQKAFARCIRIAQISHRINLKPKDSAFTNLQRLFSKNFSSFIGREMLQNGSDTYHSTVSFPSHLTRVSHCNLGCYLLILLDFQGRKFCIRVSKGSITQSIPERIQRFGRNILIIPHRIERTGRLPHIIIDRYLTCRQQECH